MTKAARIVIFLITLVALPIVFWLATGEAWPSTPQGVTLITALALLSFATLFLEHYFTTPTHVILSTLSIILCVYPQHDELSQLGLWFWVFLYYNASLFVLALVALFCADVNLPQTSLQNRVGLAVKHFVTDFGNGRVLFAALFFLTLCFYVKGESQTFIILAGAALVILMADPKDLVIGSWTRTRIAKRDVGEIIGVQSRNIFLARLYRNAKPIGRFDFAEFRYSMDGGETAIRGLVVDNYLLNEQQWIKILATPEIREGLANEPHVGTGRKNVVYKLEVNDAPEFVSRLAGVVVENSNIGALRFEYSGRVPLFEGNLLEAHSAGATVLYQVVQGMTEVETLEQKNEAGSIVGQAVQLGVWNQERLAFDKYGWVPEINNPVFLASHIPDIVVPAAELSIGSIPSTNYPVLLNVQDAISHHLAILGVTGTGKSVFCRDLLRKIAAGGTKIICVDFTNEYSTKLTDLNARSIVPTAGQAEIFAAIDAVSTELEKFPNQRNAALLSERTTFLQTRFLEVTREFLASEDHVALFELPDVANTTGILEYTKLFFRALFQIAREAQLPRNQICVVLEEAHTVIPEWNFIGVDEKRAQSLVNSIGQIALQGRKYNIGFIVVAQRTANVSKTVLTQCNSIIAFQQFDKTGAEFLSNYMGDNMVSALPTLKPRHAVAVGKAFRSGVPVIFEVPNIEEPVQQVEQAGGAVQ